PPAQQDALRGVLAEIGYAGALLARELDDGTLELIDGHLRAETTPDFPVPVLILDLTADEADKLLATHDPLGAMAGIDPNAVQSLLLNVATDNAAVQEMLSKVASQAQLENNAQNHFAPAGPEPEIQALFQLVIQCQDEHQQQELYNRLTTEGLNCRVLTL